MSFVYPEYTLDYNNGTFLLFTKSSQSEINLTSEEAMNWFARGKCLVLNAAENAIDRILDDMDSGTII